MKHYPVMLSEVIAALQPMAGETYVDGTFGNGGYTEAFLNSADCNVIALDQDPNVKPRVGELTEQYKDRFSFIETPFSVMDQVLDGQSVDAVVLDIGVSSMQLDQGERGFSFMRAGPLDMRMSQSGPSAADAINTLSDKDLARIFKVYGEERQAGRIARQIVRVREDAPIVTTDYLAELIEQTIGRRGKNHPATRVFQALRIFINDELGELFRGLLAAERLLKPGGRLIVVSFHSLEDRIVKKFLRVRSEKPPSGSRYAPASNEDAFLPIFDLKSRSAVLPSDQELSENPRSRSAKLRSATRTVNPVIEGVDSLLPRVPSLADYRWAA